MPNLWSGGGPGVSGLGRPRPRLVERLARPRAQRKHAMRLSLSWHWKCGFEPPTMGERIAEAVLYRLVVGRSGRLERTAVRVQERLLRRLVGEHDEVRGCNLLHGHRVGRAERNRVCRRDVPLGAMGDVPTSASLVQPPIAAGGAVAWDRKTRAANGNRIRSGPRRSQLVSERRGNIPAPDSAPARKRGSRQAWSRGDGAEGALELSRPGAVASLAASRR